MARTLFDAVGGLQLVDPWTSSIARRNIAQMRNSLVPVDRDAAILATSVPSNVIRVYHTSARLWRKELVRLDTENTSTTQIAITKI